MTHGPFIVVVFAEFFFRSYFRGSKGNREREYIDDGWTKRFQSLLRVTNQCARRTDVVLVYIRFTCDTIRQNLPQPAIFQAHLIIVN